MEEGAEQHRYVSQLRAEFDSCDAAAAGVLDRDGLTELCRRLQLEEQLPLLQDTLLGAHTCGRVTFEDFKDAFVAVLSRSLDLSTSEDDSSSYLEPVVPDEVKPKFVKGAKRYGRRSRPDSEPDAAETGDPTAPLPSARTEDGASSSPGGARRAKVRRSTSLDSVESLKSEDEAGSQKENVLLTLHNEGDQQEALERSDVRLQLSAEELLHHPSSHRVISGFSSAPISCSTPVRPAELQRMQLHCRQAQEEQHSVRSAGPTRLTATVGPRILSRLDDGTGCSSPERLMALWTEEGVRNSRDILQALDFPLEERLSLAELTLALDNELLVSGNGIHQAALVSYKNEIQHLQAQVEQALRQRDKLLQDLDLSDLRNLQLVREVDEHQASVESLNQSRIRELEQDYRDRLAALRWQAEQESEALLQQGELEGGALREELRLLRLQEAELREELGAAAQEGRRLEAELAVVKVKLSEAEASVSRLQGNLDQLLHDRFGAAATPSHEERFCDIIKGFERQCRDLRDRNDELSSEVELLKNQRSCRREQEADAPSWTEHQQATEFDSDESDMKCSSSPLSSRNLQPVDRAAPALSGPAVSIQTEMALEQLQQKHQRELKELHIQLETQVNYYERSLELMRQSMEVERKDISQAFKLEISELEEQKVEAEQRAKQLREAVDKLQSQQGAAAGGWSSDHERRMQRERAELEQNFAREIGNLVQRLSAEKAELEAELRLKMDQEVMAVREEAELRVTHLELQHHEGQRLLLLLQQRAFSQSERGVEELGRSSQPRVGQSESGSLEGAGHHLCQLEEELGASRLRCSELEAKLCLQEQEANALRAELEALQEATSQRAAELDCLKVERERLVQDLNQWRSTEVELEEQRRRSSQLQELLEEQQSRSSQLQELLEGEQSRSSQLQELLEGEQRRSSQLQELLEEEKEEVCRLGLEKQSYTRLVEQLSTQIVEMEEELWSLRGHLKEVSSQLNATADLVLDLRRQLNSLRCSSQELLENLQQARSGLQGKEEELERSRQQLLDSQEQLRSLQENFEDEKKRMSGQLVELETLVLALEEESQPPGPHRTQLEEVRLENGGLQERLKVLQQQVLTLEDDIDRKRRRLEELQREGVRSREEAELLQRENSRHRQEVLDLSTRNLELSSGNAELSARLHDHQGAVQKLEERLEEELSTQRDQLGRLSALEAELNGVTVRLQRCEEDRKERELEAQEQKNRVERLQQALHSLEEEAELLRSKLSTVNQEKLGHAQEVSCLQRELQDAEKKVEQLEASSRELLRQKEELHQVLETQQQQATVTQQEESRQLLLQNQELQQQLAELHKVVEEQQELRGRLSQVDSRRTQAEEQAARADAALTLARVQHVRQLQQLQETAGGNSEQQLKSLKVRLEEGQRKSQRLEEELQHQAQQSSSHISMKQEQYDKALSALQLRVEEVEAKLKGVRMVLQEKVQELKEQLAKNNSCSLLLKELYTENSQLQGALQVTEQRQKKAEKKSFLLEEKVVALNQLLRDVVRVSLAT
ncbi:ninein-like protein isoform X2 [Nelusetta ayraudi]|uniref:ninein-like protein isoform X2 n=1 Tax=Nelusetta ayraudi TaxID=303726 RepID=UPI003F6E598A